MRVIRHAANQVYKRPLAPTNLRDVGPEPRLKLLRNRRPSVLRAEYHMHHILRVGVRHVSRLQRSAYVYIRPPNAIALG